MEEEAPVPQGSYSQSTRASESQIEDMSGMTSINFSDCLTQTKNFSLKKSFSLSSDIEEASSMIESSKEEIVFEFPSAEGSLKQEGNKGLPYHNQILAHMNSFQVNSSFPFGLSCFPF